MKVRNFKAQVLGIDVLFEGFTGTVLKEYEGKDGVVVDIFSDDGAGGGIRTIAKEHVSPIAEKVNSAEYDGDTYTIRCKDCGKTRKIKPQNVNQVKRCRECQRLHNRKTALKRSLRRRGK